MKGDKFFLLEYFGETPPVESFGFSYRQSFFDYPITEIVRGSNVSYNSLKVFFNHFLNSGIIIKTRKIGKSDYYKMNLENPFVKNFIRLNWNLIKSNLELAKKPKTTLLSA